MKLDEVKSRLRDLLEREIDGLHVYTDGYSSVDAPAALLVTGPIDYWQAMQGDGPGGLAKTEIGLILAVGRADEAGSVRLVDEYVSTDGDRSIMRALLTDHRLDGYVDGAILQRVDQIDTVTISGVEYLGAAMTIEVTAR